MNWLFLPSKSIVHQQTIHCPYCTETDLQKDGKCTNGAQRYFCKLCRKHFRLDYCYNACRQGIKEKIIEMTLNCSGVRDIGRVFSISKDTVASVLKKTSKTNPYFLTGEESERLDRLEVDIRFEGEMDEFRSFVQNTPRFASASSVMLKCLRYETHTRKAPNIAPAICATM